MKVRISLDTIKVIGFYLLLILIVEALVKMGEVPSYILPAPSQIGLQFVQKGNILLRHSDVTILETIIGFALGSAAGVTLGIILAYSVKVQKYLFPLVISINSIPKSAIAPIMIVWFGFGILSKVSMAAVICFFPAVINTLRGISSVSADVIDIARSMRPTGWQMFWKVRFPNSIPFVMDGLKIGMPLALIGAIVAEFIGSDRGLGNLILVSSSNMETSLMFAGVITVTIISLVLFEIILIVEKVLRRYTYHLIT